MSHEVHEAIADRDRLAEALDALHAAERERNAALAELAAARALLAGQQRILNEATLMAKWDESEIQAIVDQLDVIGLDNGQARVNDTLIPGLARLLAIMLIKDDGGFYNFITWRVGAAGTEIGELELILQRVSGLTPADKVSELQQALDVALAECEHWRDRVTMWFEQIKVLGAGLGDPAVQQVVQRVITILLAPPEVSDP